jgi:uncharacterized coiled-coil protein SlyX
MFETKGDRAQWIVIYDHLATLQIDEIVKDETLFSLLPDAPEASVYGAFRRAMREMETGHQRTFDRVRTVGYRMVHPRETERLARGQQTKAKRRLKSAQDKAHSADRSMLDHAEKQRIDALELNLAQQRDMIRRLDRGLKVERLERKAETADLTERMDALAALLAKHGITDAEQATA